ncbi:DUF2958 domain-containing protein [Novosphingobium gossypii]|uniref:DUF2958 domain-containing protein n=1 Tax=Novosphingobium gossypii TaxID=1604774 RepID=UPI003D1D3A33
MSLLTPSLRMMLKSNAERSLRLGKVDPLPLAKLFNPIGNAVWIATELYDDGDTLFALADLGLGEPELGCFSLGEISRIHLPLGLGIQRDRAFFTRHRLSVWHATACRTRSIRDAEVLLARSAFAGRWEAPIPPISPGTGKRSGG